MRLVMLQDHLVYNKPVQAGEEFEVPDNEGENWVKRGWARASSPEDQKRRGRYNRRDMRAENVRELHGGE